MAGGAPGSDVNYRSTDVFDLPVPRVDAAVMMRSVSAVDGPSAPR